MKSVVLILSVFTFVVVLGILGVSKEEMPAYLNSKLNVESRVEDLLKRMTLEEKIEQFGGDKTGFSTARNNRLGIPGFKFTDGPHGVRWGKSTAFPVSIVLGASWDPDLMHRVGVALAVETKAKGRNQLLGPCINVIRDPRGGRSAETFGEDPYLISRMAVAYIKGVQSEKVIATPKHYAVNNQENGRMVNNVIVDERTLREFYLPHFQKSIQEAGAWSIMAAYNKMNGPHCAENHHLLKDILRNEWNFKGFVVSDWGAVHSTAPSINAGMDVEMPQAHFYGKPLLDAVKSGAVSEKTIDESVRRILRTKFWAGLFEQEPKENPDAVNTPEHRQLALESARAGIVLLKNEGRLLPFDKNKIKSIAVIGPNAAVARVSLGGSAHADPFSAVSVLEGIQNKVGKNVSVTSAKGTIMYSLFNFVPSWAFVPPDAKKDETGIQAEYFNNPELKGKPELVRYDEQINFSWGFDWNKEGSPDGKILPDYFSVRWKGKLMVRAKVQYLRVYADGGVRLYVDNKLLLDTWDKPEKEPAGVPVNLEPMKPVDFKMEYAAQTGPSFVKLEWLEPSMARSYFKALDIAKKSDVVVLAMGLSKDVESEGVDRSDLYLPKGQEQLIEEIAKVNKHIVVVVIGAMGTIMERWADRVAGILVAWYPGEQGGNAIADILFGDTNPGGKLPITLVKSMEQLPGFDNQYETISGGRGYRYYEKHKIEPLFPFGFGLSYTTFEHSNLKISPAKIPANGRVSVSAEIQNTGSYEGDEIVQLYVRDVQASVDRPIKELKGFKRISLKPGEKKKVVFTLTEEELSFYDTGKKKFVVEPGEFEVMAGSSSQDIRLKGSFEVR